MGPQPDRVLGTVRGARRPPPHSPGAIPPRGLFVANGGSRWPSADAAPPAATGIVPTAVRGGTTVVCAGCANRRASTGGPYPVRVRYAAGRTSPVRSPVRYGRFSRVAAAASGGRFAARYAVPCVRRAICFRAARYGVSAGSGTRKSGTSGTGVVTRYGTAKCLVLGGSVRYGTPCTRSGTKAARYGQGGAGRKVRYGGVLYGFCRGCGVVEECEVRTPPYVTRVGTCGDAYEVCAGIAGVIPYNKLSSLFTPVFCSAFLPNGPRLP